ncbi:four helix bundle protein [Crocosphaera sp. XPORK-15E]|uniref:four helix bundle protein n=1 Tax=Crocosphaera sp. XPORK-15E TaxID=3110247 RepID=UPI002B1FDD1C|nr:four helix bundle protein [Crocosphaera sp. XPORK-15E]MEA5532957.1 four helix bundle protein [Crocosphaera sp. XPORK-15E]
MREISAVSGIEISKFAFLLAIALKEANESDYWLELLHQSNYIDKKGYQSIINDLEEILKLLTSIIKTAKNNT